MLELERRVLEKLISSDDADSRRGRPNVNRTRHVSELMQKLESGRLSEPERIREAEAQMAANRQHARELLQSGGPPAPRPPGTGVHGMLASQAEQDVMRKRDAGQRQQHRQAVAARERHRQQHVSRVRDQEGHELFAHERALERIAKVNG